MFDPIGEPNVRSIVRPEPVVAINEREIQTQQDQKLRESRSIEKNENSAEIKKERNREESRQTSKYKQEGNTIIYEKYNKNGELILRIPPKEKPVDQLA